MFNVIYSVLQPNVQHDNFIIKPSEILHIACKHAYTLVLIHIYVHCYYKKYVNGLKRVNAYGPIN